MHFNTKVHLIISENDKIMPFAPRQPTQGCRNVFQKNVKKTLKTLNLKFKT